MKKYGILFTATALLAAVSFFLPGLFHTAVTVTLVRPQAETVTHQIYTAGNVEEEHKKEVFAELPVVPSQVLVDIGDTVTTGQLLARVDTAATQAALFSMLDAANLIPEEYMAVIGNISLPENLITDHLPTEILAPSSGVVTSVGLIEGVLSLPTAAICTISSLDRLRLRMTVSETDADLVKEGDTVVFRASATGSQKYEGTVERVFPTATKTVVGTGVQVQVGLYVKPAKDYPRLKPGYSVNGVIVKEEGEVMLTIPYEAVRQDNQNVEYVYLYEDGRAVRRDIVTGTELSYGVCVEEGLTGSDILILNAADIPAEGCPVRYAAPIGG